MDQKEIVIIRTQAESTSNPEHYERAAAEFEAIGMLAAAGRCRDRARYYRGIHGIKPTSVPCVQPIAASMVEQIHPGELSRGCREKPEL